MNFLFHFRSIPSRETGRLHTFTPRFLRFVYTFHGAIRILFHHYFYCIAGGLNPVFPVLIPASYTVPHLISLICPEEELILPAKCEQKKPSMVVYMVWVKAQTAVGIFN